VDRDKGGVEMEIRMMIPMMVVTTLDIEVVVVGVPVKKARGVNIPIRKSRNITT
jgi:hypothetical protein